MAQRQSLSWLLDLATARSGHRYKFKVINSLSKISGIKARRIGKDRCKATSTNNLTKPNIMSDYISHDHEHDGIDRRGFLHCMAWAGTGLLWTISGGVLASRTLAQIAQAGESLPTATDLRFVKISDSHMRVA